MGLFVFVLRRRLHASDLEEAARKGRRLNPAWRGPHPAPGFCFYRFLHSWRPTQPCGSGPVRRLKRRGSTSSPPRSSASPKTEAHRRRVSPWIVLPSFFPFRPEVQGCAAAVAGPTGTCKGCVAVARASFVPRYTTFLLPVCRCNCRRTGCLGREVCKRFSGIQRVPN